MDFLIQPASAWETLLKTVQVQELKIHPLEHIYQLA